MLMYIKYMQNHNYAQASYTKAYQKSFTYQSFLVGYLTNDKPESTAMKEML